MKKILIKKNVLKNILRGHPWIFSGAIDKNSVQNIKDGELIEIFCEDKFIGIGYYNSKTDIAIRILTRANVKIDKSFFLNRFKILKENKEKFLKDTNSYRLVFGESDNIPGLVVDLYNKVIVIQVHTLGIELLKNYIIDALKELFKPVMIYEKSDIGIREKEGLKKESTGLLYGRLVEYVEITENGIKFNVNIVKGQKTGFFLDQRENRKSLQKYSKNRNILNCFCYTGGFSLYVAFNAKSVTSIDISKDAIEDAKKNFIINGLDVNKYRFISQDVFEFLKDIKKDQFDMIILDPPSFAKNKKQIKNAIKAYITINSKSLEKLPDYGILVSSSCTSHIDEPTFIKILHTSAVNANCQLKVLESKCQPYDHSYNLSFPEGRYLKFFVLQKIPIL